MSRPAIEADDWLRLAGRLLAVGVVLVANAIPLYGVLRLHWSVADVLVLFWVENLLAIAGTCATIAAHRHATRKLGHWRAGQLGDAPSDRIGSGTLLRDHATITLFFTLAHGVFVVAVLVAQAGDPRWRLSPDAVREGTILLAGVLACAWLADLPALRRRPFALLRRQVRQRTGRVFVLHLAIIAGAWTLAAVDSGAAFLFVLIGLKTAWDLALALAPGPAHERSPAPRMQEADAAARIREWALAQDTARLREREDERAAGP